MTPCVAQEGTHKLGKRSKMKGIWNSQEAGGVTMLVRLTGPDNRPVFVETTNVVIVRHHNDQVTVVTTTAARRQPFHHGSRLS